MPATSGPIPGRWRKRPMRMNVGTSGATGGPCIGALTNITDGVMKRSRTPLW